MNHPSLPPRARLLQAILSRRAVEARYPINYYAIADMAYGAALLATDDEALSRYLTAVADDAQQIAALGGHND